MNRMLRLARLFLIITILFAGLKANSQTIDNWGVVGSATPNGWGGPDIPLSYNAGLNTWSAVVSLNNGEIKFRNNNDWSFNYGDDGANGTLDRNGSNIIVTAGRYLITLDFTTLNYSISQVKAYYVNDNSPTGDLFTSAIGNNINTGTKAAPFATITHALSQAAEGDTIYVDAGTYIEQVTIYKGIVITGAGQNLTSILKPAIIVAPPAIPPSTFNEPGVIQTAQSITGDVHINNLSVTGDLGGVNIPAVTPIILQTGGSVKNCKLQNGNQGVFVRIDPSINLNNKTFVIDGNTINAEYIGVNFAGGNRLTATLSNNTLATFNTGFSTGVFAGTDFGTLTRLTVSGNIFSSYVTDGLFVNTNNGIISKNSFLGTGPKAINKFGGSTINATCNWFGSQLAATVVSKITAGVNFSPWLISGIDNSTAVGFQTSATCPVANSFYVNDNSTTSDVFTTAIGNNVNGGTFNAPYATLDYALSQVPAGATIYVDAGTYALASALTINKSITILGSNYLVSPNDATTKSIYNSSRNAESRITGAALQIAANNIYIKGLRFSPTASAISQNGNYNRVIMDKNYFDVTGTGNTLSLQGSSGNPIVAFDYSVTDSRFERTDLVNGGSSINLGWVKSLWIDNNVFIESPASGNPYRGIGVRTVSGQSVEGLAFTNNYVKKLNIGVFPQLVQDMGVSDNVFDSCTTGYSHSPFGAVSNNIFISSNTFTNTRVGRSILVRGSSNGGVNNLNVRFNTINQEVDGINGIVGMIQLDFAATSNNGTVLIQGNKLNLSGNYSNAFFKTQCGIMLMGKHNNTTLSYNELNFTAINQIFNPSNFIPSIPTGIFINTDGGTGSGPIPAGSIINITNNIINGFKSSIGIYDPTPTGLTPTVGYGYLTNGATVNISNNHITGDSMSIDNGVVSQGVNASCNWYGSASAQNFIHKLTLPTVDIVPWLTNGTDNFSGTGFEPVANTCDGYPTLITLNSSTNVTCNGAANGTINITTSYGKAPFTYTWTKDGDANFVSNNEDLTGIAPGTYRLAITDGNGSNIYIIDENADGPGTIVVTITEPDVLTASATGDNNVCFNGSIGTASVVPTGGTAPYIYLWSNGATTDEITNLIAGIYSVTITDANGCTTIASYEVTQPAQVLLSITNSSTACSNIATANASGGTPGTPAYTYLWSNGSTSATISGVPVGTYSVTVTDANGCTATASVTLTVAEAFNPSAAVTNVTCFNANNGIITITNVNGTAPFMFSKDGGVTYVSGAFPFSFNGLEPRTYTIAVKDANGCVGFVEKIITQPTALVATLNTLQNTCLGFSTGSITVTVSGGSPAYSYSWTGLNGTYTSSQLNISNLAAGNYTLTVKDKNNCVAVVPVTVNPFPAVIIARTITDVACRGGATGSINITATGGTGSGFTYSWTGGIISSNEDLNNITKGTYKIRVTDNGSGCIVDSTFIINEPTSNLALVTARTNAISCSSLGTITGTGSGGTAPYTYNLNGGTYSSSGVFNGLYAGSYTIGIMDARGCTTTKVVAITDNGADEYEGTASNKNNTKAKAFSIPIETNIYARIPTVADSLDWYKFTTVAAGNYTITFNHPNTSIVFDVYTATGTIPMAPLTGSTPTAKTYSFAAGTQYFIKVYGALSFICYDLKVSFGGAARFNNSQAPANETANTMKPVIIVEGLKAATYPNPHQGSFAIAIESPEQGIAMIELFAANGQLISERKINVTQGKGNIVQYNNMHQTVIYYRIKIGKHIVTGKVIGPN